MFSELPSAVSFLASDTSDIRVSCAVNTLELIECMDMNVALSQTLQPCVDRHLLVCYRN